MHSERPNVILFTTDQHRGDHLSIAGHPVVETPNVDSFIQHGAYFPNAYSEIPSTTGARRIMHGGQGSYACGLVGYSSAEWHEPNTLASVLADSGYHCINVGWRNMHPRRKLYGFHTVIPHDLRPGVDDYDEWLKRELGPHANEFAHGVDPNGWTARPWHLEDRHHPSTWTTAVTLEQIEKRDPTRPFFVWCSHLRPHSPYDPPQAFWDMYVDRELPEVPVGDWAQRHGIPNPGLDFRAWRGKLTGRQLHRMRVGYMGSVTHLDYELGSLMRGLHEMNLVSNTLFVFVSDHGDMQGDHNLLRKTYAYEGSARIPFVIQYPRGMDAPAGTFDHVVGLQDVMPTILDVCGVPVPDSVTGRSVLDAVRGSEWRAYIHGEHSPCYSMDEAMHFLTDGHEKYVWLPYTAEERFFDLDANRNELRNLSGSTDAADRVALWRNRLIELLSERGDGFVRDGKLVQRTDWWPPEVGG